MFKEYFTELNEGKNGQNLSKMKGPPKKFGVPSIAGISNYLSYEDGYLRFNFDFSDEYGNNAQTASFYFQVYENKLKIQITGREDFSDETTWAKRYAQDIIGSKFFAPIEKIIGRVSLKKWYNDGYIFEKEITEKETIKINKVLEKLF